MSGLEFEVSNARAGTVNQRKFGILATFNLNIVVDGVKVVTLSDMNVRKTKDGRSYISSQYREYESKGEKRKIYFSKVFPDDRDNESQRGIIDQVKRACDEGNARASSKPPVQKTRPAPTSSGDDVW